MGLFSTKYENLARQFALDLGLPADIRGMSRTEIEEGVGPPNSITTTADGLLLTWIQTRRTRFVAPETYHIALLFDENDICVGIVHEFYQ